MKIITFILALITLIGCITSREINGTKAKGRFTYVLPLPVEEEAWNHIKERGFESKNLFFQLRRGNEFYHLLITPTDNLNKEYIGYFKVLSSNRTILINDKFYPIVFDTDYDFGSLINNIESIEERKKRFLSDEYSIKRAPYVTNNLTFGIKFTKLGEIVK